MDDEASFLQMNGAEVLCLLLLQVLLGQLLLHGRGWRTGS